MVKCKHVSAIAALTGLASAATSISDQQMTDWLNAGGVGLADAYAPKWFFAESQNRLPCIPTWTFDGSPDANDIYDMQHKTQPGAQCQYPDVGCNCRNPQAAIGFALDPFPIYYSFQRCSDNEVRVAYNLFYQKDGALLGAIKTGHDYDWERVIVVHNKDSGANSWSPSQLFMSQHSGYGKKKWSDVQSTLTSDQARDLSQKGPDNVKNQDHPKVYISWSKHAHYDTRSTGWTDAISQSTDRAVRSDDWYYYVDPKYYIRSDSSTDAGKAIASTTWGGGDSIPPKVQDGLCKV